MGTPVQIIAFDVGIRNFAYCVLHVHEKNRRTIRALEVVDLGVAKNNKQGAIDACIDLLDEIVFQKIDTSLPTIVLIEQQMTAAMKAIMVAINVFFKMTAKYHGMEVTSKYLSAKHKLSFQEQYPDYAPNESVANSSYKQNKLDSIHFGTWYLQEKLQDHEQIQKIATIKKKDDLFDALLMTIYYADKCL